MWGNTWCMYARPHRRKAQLTLRSLRDLCSRLVFAPVRPRLARCKHKLHQGARVLEGTFNQIQIEKKTTKNWE